MGSNTVTLCAVGDIAAFHEDPESAFDYVGPLLREADITFAQNERHYSDRADIAQRGTHTELASVKNAAALRLGGFDVLSFASNHSMDLGADIMLETAGVLRGLGAAVIGVGRNIEEARRPVIIERKGARVGFLAYCSVLRSGHNAGPDRAGCVPMRAWTLYSQADYQPGTPPEILTFPHREDLQALIEDIRKIRAKVDVLVLSCHWGIHLHHAMIAMYQKDVAHAAIDAGADIILGHHPHQLKGIEVYRGKPIFYSMGNFAFDFPLEELQAWMKQSPDFARLMQMAGWKPDPAWRVYPWPPESRKSMIVRCHIVGGKVQRVSFLPVLINRKAQPRVIPRENRNFDVMLRYMQEITESQGLSTEFSVDGNEIVVPLA